jgi:hypothetical protein
MFTMRGVPVREIHGLPYTIHQIGDNEWQVAIQNCPRHPAGYAFASVYGSYEEAFSILQQWPEQDAVTRGQVELVSRLAQFED